MFSKIQITGTVEVVTGMHIGGNSAFAAIGAVDSPVIKDSRSKLPMIPGSSLKGKIRTLLAKKYNDAIVEPENDAENILRLFGSSKKNNIRPSRIIFSDMVMENEKELRRQDVTSMTEVKFENSINRQTAVANPRQIERVIRGAQFDLDLIYEAQNESEVLEDMRLLAEGMKLLEYDYLGGHGSRGYGKVKFKDIQAEVVIGELSESVEEQLGDIFRF
ncbi:MAG: type III-A CRISPR-associated RAMP protein Csm3 [Lachnospiraceae bacterium]|nr:type III-A CRISPR-associated RAMP protein Csm3 [Lachnospiraceae bacterium]